MLPQLEAFLQASSKVKSFQIIDNDPLDEENYLVRIRCELIQEIVFKYDSEQIPAASGTLIRN
jgi:hypothetical protein